MRNLCECVDMYVRKYTWPKLRGVAMCVHAKIKNAKFNSKAISWFLRKFAPSKISRYTVSSLYSVLVCVLVHEYYTLPHVQVNLHFAYTN